MAEPKYVGILVVRKTDSGLTLLVQKRVKSWIDGSDLAFIGGHIDATDKDPYSAVLRELKEEGGLDEKDCDQITALPYMAKWECQSYVAFLRDNVVVPGPLPDFENEVVMEFGHRGHKWVSEEEFIQLHTDKKVCEFSWDHYVLSKSI